MKVRILKPCADRYTQKMYQPGVVIEVADQRGLEIIDRGFGAPVEPLSVEIPEDKPKAEPKAAAKKKAAPKAKKRAKKSED